MKSEKRNKLVLAALLAALAVYSYAALLLSPVQAEAARLRGDLEQSQQRLRIDSSELKRLQASERAALAEADLDARSQQLLDTMPTSFMASTPPLMLRMFQQRELTNAKANLLLLLPFRGSPDRLLARWEVLIPEAHALRFGEALADFENRFPLGQLTELALQANAAAGTVRVSMAFQTAVHP